MTRNDDVLDRLAPLSGAPSRDFEDLLRLRDKRQRARKVGAFAVVAALVAVLVGVGLGAIGDRSGKPVNTPDESRAPAFTGLVVEATGNDCNDRPGDLVAKDPRTGETITLVDIAKVFGSPGSVAWASASADGRWFAFEGRHCDATAPTELWVTNGSDEPRQLTTTPFDSGPSGSWAWSPTGSQLVTLEGNHLVLIDPATGDRTDLGQAAGDWQSTRDMGSLAWSPDGTQIAYGGNWPHASVYVVSVDGGEHALIAESLGQVPGGEEGAGIAWSPDGTRLVVLADKTQNSPWSATLYVMNADGSERLPLAEAVLTQHSLGSPNVVWSPDGTRVAYATVSDERYDFPFRIWSAAPDGSAPVLIFDATGPAPGLTGGPIWSPDGTQIAFRYGKHSSQRSYLVANADGKGDVHEIDELEYKGWRGGWYFCECFG